MQLFEEPVDSIFTLGPAQVLRVEERREPADDPKADRNNFKSRVRWRSFGVVIYICRQKAVPVQKGESWVMPEEAIETRFIRVLGRANGCDIPPEAGRFLGHYQEDGQRWWVFLEKLGAAPSPPAPAARPRSVAQSPSAKAPGSASSPAPRAPQPASPPQASPGKTEAPRPR